MLFASIALVSQHEIYKLGFFSNIGITEDVLFVMSQVFVYEIEAQPILSSFNGMFMILGKKLPEKVGKFSFDLG